MVEKKRMNLSGMGRAKSTESVKASESAEKKAATSAAAKASKAQEAQAVETDEDDDEDILSGVAEKGKSNNNMLFIVLAIGLAVIVILAFLIIGGKRSSPSATSSASSSSSTSTGQQPTKQEENQGSSGSSGTSDSSKDTEYTPDGVGTQNFLEDTNMTTSDVLTDPDAFVEDLYGLTTRVDYTVNSISNIADFVSYEKHRGTWGGGLELYWLDATYKNNHYVVQVPFEYYKELDDVGIVPVKMEVLTINGSTAGEKLNIISYMCLDEEVLKDILKEQAKAKK